MGDPFLKKKSPKPLRGAIGESSIEVLDLPYVTRLSQEPLTQTGIW